MMRSTEVSDRIRRSLRVAPPAPAIALATALALTLATALVGCAGQEPAPPQSETTPPTSETTRGATPPAVAEGFFEQITAADYQSWSPAPGYEERQPAKGPHGDETRIFLDPASEKALADGAGEWPQGAVIVKDVYKDDVLIQVAAMRKDDGGWYWGEWEPDGTEIVEGLKAEPCESCHSKGTDGTLAVKLGE